MAMTEQKDHQVSTSSFEMQNKMDAVLEEARRRVKHLVMQARQAERLPAEFLELRLKTAHTA